MDELWGIFRVAYLKLTPNVTLSDYKITNQIVFHKPVGEGSDNPQVILHVRHIVRDYRPEHRRCLEGSVVITVKDKDVHESIELPVKIGKSGEEVIGGGH